MPEHDPIGTFAEQNRRQHTDELDSRDVAMLAAIRDEQANPSASYVSPHSHAVREHAQAADTIAEQGKKHYEEHRNEYHTMARREAARNAKAVSPGHLAVAKHVELQPRDPYAFIDSSSSILDEEAPPTREEWKEARHEVARRRKLFGSN